MIHFSENVNIEINIAILEEYDWYTEWGLR